MDSKDVFWGIILGFLVVYIIIILIALAIRILNIVANWKLYEKAGEQGWGAIIPVYSFMQQIKIATGNYILAWIYLGAIGVMFLIYGFMGFMAGVMGADISSEPIMMAIMVVPYIVMIPIYVIAGYVSFMYSKSFGKSTSFCVLSIFFPPIMQMIMGFDKRTVYIGPQGELFNKNKNSDIF